MADNNILYGKKIADRVLKQVAEEAKKLGEIDKSPLLMTIKVGEDPASKVYMSSQRRIAEMVGIKYEALELAESTSQSRLMRIIDGLNQDPYINGLVVHVPLPEHLDSKQVQWHIHRQKDVEGVTPYNLGRLFLGVHGLIPCTALAIVDMIKSTGTELCGKEVTIVGHSNIVGKPCAILLLQEEATVSVCHYATAQRGFLEEHVRRAEILVAAAGQPGLIKGEWIKPGAIVIDAGINAVDDSLVGDVEFKEARQRASYITPVPGGVGAVTVAYLMKNTVEAVHWQLRNNGLGV